MVDEPQPQAPAQKDYRRAMPRTDLDFNLMTTDSVWGSPEINPQLHARVSKYFVEYNTKGEEILSKESMWGLLGFYTRDMRLANLSVINGEINYCQYFLDLAGDFLQAQMYEPFLICLSRVATMLELSQSKGGFLRRRMNTFTAENISRDLDGPKKKSLFGSNQKKN